MRRSEKRQPQSRQLKPRRSTRLRWRQPRSYAYAAARQRDVVCVAHVTNTMATRGDDFEKGEDNGTHRILAVVDAIAQRWSNVP